MRISDWSSDVCSSDLALQAAACPFSIGRISALIMENYPPTARARVAEMIAAAEAEPNRAVAFQGAPGAYSHQAVRELYDHAAALPCFSFADAIDSVGEGSAERRVG